MQVIRMCQLKEELFFDPTELLDEDFAFAGDGFRPALQAPDECDGKATPCIFGAFLGIMGREASSEVCRDTSVERAVGAAQEVDVPAGHIPIIRRGDGMVYSRLTPMSDLKEIYDRMHLSRNEKKTVNEVIRDVFAQSKSYQEVVDKLKEIKAKKLQLEHEIRGQFVKEMEKLEQISESLKADAEMLSDLALSKLMKGETVEITDENNVTYEPVFKVAFKKSK